MARYKLTQIPDDYFITTLYGGIVAGRVTTKFCGRTAFDAVEWVQTDTKEMGGMVLTIPHIFPRRYDAAIACNTHDSQRRATLAQSRSRGASKGDHMQPQAIPVDQRPADIAAWQFLEEQWHSGLFTVQATADGTFVATFTDDGEVIPFTDMAYNQELGLYRRSNQ